ncbi:hypothetical protein [Corynebacterium pelargi]|uniref:Uncharacterized protein n=1 Tax=Corynebacterium pelargi TaxID=1471400 RepID=A0A410WAP8_9CORY|nr:hypothetical protein [Corynebacterium pelargi]QAU53042.1 hypothetical protein CPELA_08935 [Corynebacterium pelargi]GGG75244.1 hypothetical protein GCM10007338_10980 [Corynebacterium pelargi]
MQLPKPLRALATVLIVLFLLIVAGMIFKASQEEQQPLSGKRLEATLQKLEDQNIHIAGLVMADLYGTEWMEAATVCSGMTVEQVEQLGVGSDLFAIEEGSIPMDKNYLVFVNQDGDFASAEFNTEDVNLCFQGQPTAFRAYDMNQFYLDGDTWILAG